MNIGRKRRAHLGLTILTDAVPARLRKILLVIGFAIGTAFSAALCYYGIRSWGLFALALFLGYVPIIIEYAALHKDPDTKLVKHSVAIGYAIFFTYTLFLSQNHQIFLFVLPMILVISVFGDVRYCILSNLGILIELIIMVIIGSKTGRYTYTNIDTGIVQIIAITMFAADSFYTTRTHEPQIHQGTWRRTGYGEARPAARRDSLRRDRPQQALHWYSRGRQPLAHEPHIRLEG